MINMCSIVDRSNHIPVDEWGTEAYPIAEEDKIFRNIKGEIILPIAEFFSNGDDEEKKQLDYFAMNSKRSYNSDIMRDHICQYLNYFLKYYDTDKELLMVIYNIKLTIDYMKDYSKDRFLDDINKYIIRNTSLGYKISHFVADNYTMKLKSNGNKTPNLQFCDSHAKILYEISLLMNMYIPLCSHYCYIHFIKKSSEVQDFMLSLFDMCVIKYEEEQDIYIYEKIYETCVSIVNKSKNADKILWQKNVIRGVNTTTHILESVNDTILQIMPKYNYVKNIINFNYFTNRKSLNYKITDIAYEMPFVKLSSSKRDADQNSEFDKYEARIAKKDGALSLQNKVAAEAVFDHVVNLYGPFSDEEVEHYRKKLTCNGSALINPLQFDLLGYVYYKDLGDPVTWKAIPNGTAYIKMLIAAKRMFLNSGMVILPYIFSSRVTRLSTRKVIGKKDSLDIHNSDLYEDFKRKYNNPKLEQELDELIGRVESSSFEIIDWDTENNCPGEYDGKMLPMINYIINQEMLFYSIMI